MDALPHLTVRQLAEMSSTPGQLRSAAQVNMVMSHVQNQQLPAFFDYFSPAIMVSQNNLEGQISYLTTFWFLLWYFLSSSFIRTVSNLLWFQLCCKLFLTKPISPIPLWVIQWCGSGSTSGSGPCCSTCLLTTLHRSLAYWWGGTVVFNCRGRYMTKETGILEKTVLHAISDLITGFKTWTQRSPPSVKMPREKFTITSFRCWKVNSSNGVCHVSM